MTAKRFHSLLAGCLLSGAIALYSGTPTLAPTAFLQLAKVENRAIPLPLPVQLKKGNISDLTG